MVRSFLEAITNRFDWLFCASGDKYGRPPLYKLCVASWLSKFYVFICHFKSTPKNPGIENLHLDLLQFSRQEWSVACSFNIPYHQRMGIVSLSSLV